MICAICLGFADMPMNLFHSIRPVSDIFSDIITVYGMDYVISGPVWEYYAGDSWKEGMIQEIREDRLCGFIGKNRYPPFTDPCSKQSLSDFTKMTTLTHGRF